MTSVAIVVLGMHRSGTSATAGLLHHLGLPLGDNLMRPEAGSNERGFFENYDIVVQHDRVLKAMGSDWHDHEPLPTGWQELPEVMASQAEIGRLVAAQFAEHRLWAIKDPRMCRLLTLWAPIFTEQDTHPYYVLVFRHPLEVAQSLQKRDGMALETGLRLWYVYMREAERLSRGAPRVFLPYIDLLKNWRRQVKRLRREFLFKDFKADRTQARAIDAYLQPSERHHDADTLGDEVVLPARIEELHQRLLRATNLTRQRENDLFAEFDLQGEPEFADSAAWWRAEAYRWQGLAQKSN